MSQQTLQAAQHFVDWFRTASPYIYMHHGRTFVISFDGDALQHPHFKELIQDIALLNVLGIRVIIVYGIRPQIDAALQRRGLESKLANGRRITDEQTLQCVLSSCGEVNLMIQSYLSMGLSNVPISDTKIQVVSGNFVMAKPLGVQNGVDYHYTGEVRKIDSNGITHQLNKDAIVLIPPVGYSPTGEIFNLLAEEVATAVAIELRAAKWVCLHENEGLIDDDNQLVRQLTFIEAQKWLNKTLDNDSRSLLENAIKACRNGVERVHLITQKVDGSLLLELFSRDGIGTLISYDPYENTRQASIQDIGGLLELIQPLEQAGALVRRSREKLEMEVDQFTVQERDGMIVACAALYPFAQEKTAELACFAVHEKYRGMRKGDEILAYLELLAKKQGLKSIFVLTTRTAHWFIERGFVEVSPNALPTERQELYNFQRNSKVFMKYLMN
ncbi:amino-acid N-acetyltransferase [Candidatus Albibeggiatoa sp. nov. NOAA]|uniref:amino-acid N-acetyltransferase n=1 Tax=Candidatus Albibeggiatoa sp. nov. NOAA TaxID=3162724 RepID=UPI0032F8B7A1|nr:amino-acid N-acetyltransferase [Thiotrichaceae bacterium]